MFNEADQLTMSVYKATQSFPRDEWFGLRAQARRAAVSIASNLVEGNARRTTRSYMNFLDISRGSAAELEYLIELATDLGYLAPATSTGLLRQCSVLIPRLEALLAKMEVLALQEEDRRRTGTVNPRRSGVRGAA